MTGLVLLLVSQIQIWLCFTKKEAEMCFVVDATSLMVRHIMMMLNRWAESKELSACL